MRAPAKTIDKARRLRRALSAPEARLWRCLKGARAGAAGFRRQHPIGPYVSLLLREARLAIEIDGANHDVGDPPQGDARRDAWLANRG